MELIRPLPLVLTLTLTLTHRQPEFDPRIDAQNIVLTLTLALSLPNPA